ncbi:hypothetical protein [Lysobacter olei]
MNVITQHLPAWNSWLALALYWMPLALCAYGYLVRSISMYRADLADRAEAARKPTVGFYYPKITIGTLVGYAFVSVVPVANLFAAIFDVAPKLFAQLFDWCGRVLDIPLVPKKAKEPTE